MLYIITDLCPPNRVFDIILSSTLPYKYHQLYTSGCHIHIKMFSRIDTICAFELAATANMIRASLQALNSFKEAILAGNDIGTDCLQTLLLATSSFVPNIIIWKPFYSKIIRITQDFLDIYEDSPSYSQNILATASIIFRFALNYGYSLSRFWLLFVLGQIQHERRLYTDASILYRTALRITPIEKTRELQLDVKLQLAHLRHHQAMSQSKSSSMRRDLLEDAIKILKHGIAEFDQTSTYSEDYLKSLCTLALCYVDLQSYAEAFRVVFKLQLACKNATNVDAAVIEDLLNPFENADLPFKEIDEGMIESGEACTICLDSWTFGQTATQLPCQHLFHFDCIREWLSTTTKRACPLCKVDPVD
jgi:tetratricopeptide (TPR) repeat protein